jgi:hypothetical protein
MPSSVIGLSSSGCSLQLCTVLRIGHFIEPYIVCYSCPLYFCIASASRARPLQNAHSRESSWYIFLIFVLDSPCDYMEIRGKIFSAYFRSPLPFSFPPLPALRAIRAPPASRRRPYHLTLSLYRSAGNTFRRDLTTSEGAYSDGRAVGRASYRISRGPQFFFASFSFRFWLGWLRIPAFSAQQSAALIGRAASAAERRGWRHLAFPYETCSKMSPLLVQAEIP